MKDINQLSKKHKTFIELAVVQQVSYKEISETMKIPSPTLSQWWAELKEIREQVSTIRKVWKKKCESLSFWDFYQWFSETPRGCHYCGITETDVAQLINKKKIDTKRITTRGKSLEIERLSPNEKYDNTLNLVYCCYWCNNAKTDEFTAQEFAPIGKEIAKIWQARIQ